MDVREISREINVTVIAIEEGETIDYTKPFLFRFDISLIGNPNSLFSHHVSGKDPVWKMFGEFHHFVEPKNEGRPEKYLAYWSLRADPNTAYFHDLGFLRKNPTVPGQFVFCWSPDEDPFKKEKGKMIYY